MAHLQLVHPADVPRFAELQVAANVQALWACSDDQMVDLTVPFLGEERAARQYPFGDLHRAGARLVAGSDWPVSTPNPLEAIHVAVHRMAYGEPGRAGSEPFLPDQALSLEVALAAYTSGSAWVCHRDDAGMVEPGAVADLVLLDRDPSTPPTRSAPPGSSVCGSGRDRRVRLTPGCRDQVLRARTMKAVGGPVADPPAQHDVIRESDRMRPASHGRSPRSPARAGRACVRRPLPASGADRQSCPRRDGGRPRQRASGSTPRRAGA